MPAKKPVRKSAASSSGKPKRTKGAGSTKRKKRATGSALTNFLVVNMIPRSLKRETEQDSEPFIAVNPANPLQIVGSAFTPDPFGGPQAPIYISNDGGNTWDLRSTVPSNVQTGDITVAYSGGTNNLYSGILRRPGNLLLNILRTKNAFGTTPMKYFEPNPGRSTFCAGFGGGRQRSRLRRRQ